jgi:hypothetical protein
MLFQILYIINQNYIIVKYLIIIKNIIYIDKYFAALFLILCLIKTLTIKC